MLANSTQVPPSTVPTSGAPLPVTNGATGSQVFVQFQDPGYGQTYTAQPIQAPPIQVPQIPVPQIPAQPTRLQPGVPPAQQATHPGAGDGTGRKADTMKSFVLGSYAAARTMALAPTITTQETTQRLESYRLICHELINKSWAAGRLDLAVAVAGDALPLYRGCAQFLLTQAKIAIPEFYANFSAWGLDRLNASLQQLSMMGHALRCAWRPRLPDGRVNPPRVSVLRTAETLLPTGGRRAQPDVWRDVRDTTGATPQAPSETATVTNMATNTATAGKNVAREGNEQKQDSPVEVIEKLWQKLALTHELNGAAFTLLMKQHTHFTSNLERVRFGMTLVELLKGLVNWYHAGILKMEKETFRECLSAGFARIGLLNRAYHDKFASERQPAQGWQSGGMQDGEEGQAGEVSLEGDDVRVHFIWSLAHSGQFFAHFKDFYDNSSHSVSSWIAPQRVINLLEALFPGEGMPATIVLSQHEQHCLASLSFSSNERSLANFVHVVRDASQRLAELPPLPAFTAPRLPLDAPGGTSGGAQVRAPFVASFNAPVTMPSLAPDGGTRTARATAITTTTATTATSPSAGSARGPSSAPSVAPSIAFPMLDEYQPMDEFGSLFGGYADDDFF